MKTVMALTLIAACALACRTDRTTKTNSNSEPVDTTRTTSAVLVDPTLHEGHAAQPNNVDQKNVDQNVDQSYEEQNMDMDVDQDMSGTRDGG